MHDTTYQPGSQKTVARTRVGLALMVFVTALMAGCATTVDAPPTTAAHSASASPSAATTPSPDACGPSTGQEAAADAIAELSLPPGLEGAQWDAADADYSGYDPCAALSWSLVTLVGATGSTPTAVLLFHSGTYLGTATKTAYGFTPAVERTADGAISVTYRFVQGAESNADASGRAVATFAWNAETGSVDMAGDVPSLEMTVQ